MVEEVAPELEHDPLADACEAEPGEGAEDPSGGVDANVGEHDEQQPPFVVAANPAVDRVADEVPAGDGCRRRECGEQGDDREAALALGGVGNKAREPGVVSLTRQRTRLRREP